MVMLSVVYEVVSFLTGFDDLINKRNKK